MNKDLKKFLDQSLVDHFNNFLEIKINNATLNIMPMQKDIPVVTTAKYYKDKDFIEIILNDYTNLTEYMYRGVTFLLTKDNILAGIRLHHFREFIYSQIKKMALEELESDRKSTPTDTRTMAIEKRKLSFFSDVLRSPEMEAFAH